MHSCTQRTAREHSVRARTSLRPTGRQPVSTRSTRRRELASNLSEYSTSGPVDRRGESPCSDQASGVQPSRLRSSRVRPTSRTRPYVGLAVAPVVLGFRPQGAAIGATLHDVQEPPPPPHGKFGAPQKATRAPAGHSFAGNSLMQPSMQFSMPYIVFVNATREMSVTCL